MTSILNWMGFKKKKERRRSQAQEEVVVVDLEEVGKWEERLGDAKTKLRGEINKVLEDNHLKLCDEKRVSLAVATFNVGEALPRSDEAESVYLSWLNAHCSTDTDIFAIGIQEIDMSAGSVLLEEKSPKTGIWEGFISRHLDKIGPYTKLISKNMAGLLLLVFVKDGLVAHCSNLAVSVVRIGVRNFANKGAIAVRFTICGRRVLLLNAHLEAHTERVHRRNKGYDRILSELRFKQLTPDDATHYFWPTTPCGSNLGTIPQEVALCQEYLDAEDSLSLGGFSDEEGVASPAPGGEEKEVEIDGCLLHDYDYVFWFGDLNYRLWNIENGMVRSMIKNGKLEDLLSKDQLAQARVTNTAFSEFKECPITFPPTYKYDPGSDTYDSSAKQRSPSWTDRILFLSRPRTGYPPHDPSRHEDLTSHSYALPMTSSSAHNYFSFYSCNEQAHSFYHGRSVIDNTSPSQRSRVVPPKEDTSPPSGIPLCHTPSPNIDPAYTNLLEVPVAKSGPVEDHPPGLRSSIKIDSFLDAAGQLSVTMNKDNLKDLQVTTEGGILTVKDVKGELERQGVVKDMMLTSIDGVHVGSAEDLDVVIGAGGSYRAVFLEKTLSSARVSLSRAHRVDLSHNELVPTPASYAAHPIRISDHRPVSCRFTLLCSNLRAEKAQEYLKKPEIAKLAQTINEINSTLVKLRAGVRPGN